MMVFVQPEKIQSYLTQILISSLMVSMRKNKTRDTQCGVQVCGEIEVGFKNLTPDSEFFITAGCSTGLLPQGLGIRIK